METKVIYTGALSLNNKVDQIRQRTSETALIDLQEAVDVDIDETGRVSRRLGQVPISTVPSHSLFRDKGDAFVVQDRTSDSAIYRIESDFSLTGVVSSLTKGLHVSFAQIGNLTYYINGVQKGYILDAVSYPWPGSTHIGAQYSAEYYTVPMGTKICFFQGRIWVAEGKVIWVSEYNSFGKFRKARMFFQFGTNVLMMRPVKNGVFIGTEVATGFIRAAEKFEDYSWENKLPVPAHEYSECSELVNLENTMFQVKGESAVWSCDLGGVIGTENGDFIIFTEPNLFYSTGSNGASVVVEDVFYNNVY